MEKELDLFTLKYIKNSIDNYGNLTMYEEICETIDKIEQEQLELETQRNK